jgi:hypothetical protein
MIFIAETLGPGQGIMYYLSRMNNVNSIDWNTKVNTGNPLELIWGEVRDAWSFVLNAFIFGLFNIFLDQDIIV